MDDPDGNAIIDIMAQLIVRNVDDALVKRLKARAARSGRSAEAEHREILRTALLGPKPKKNFKELLFSMPNVGDDKDFARASDRGRKIDL
jgi:plasmid stability protein